MFRIQNRQRVVLCTWDAHVLLIDGRVKTYMTSKVKVLAAKQQPWVAQVLLAAVVRVDLQGYARFRVSGVARYDTKAEGKSRRSSSLTSLQIVTLVSGVSNP